MITFGFFRRMVTESGITESDLLRLAQDRKRAAWYRGQCALHPTQPQPTDLRCYVVVNRQILNLVRSGVQSAHALTELVMQHGSRQRVQDWHHHHKTLLVLQGHEADLDRAKRHAAERGLVSVDFREPDIGNLVTATAFEPMTAEEGAMFAGLELLH